MRNFAAILLLLSLPISASSEKGQLRSRQFTSNTALGKTDFYLESEEKEAVWLIKPGVKVTGGRFYIGSASGGNKGSAHFILDGGGSLVVDTSRPDSIRLGQNGNSELGQLTIKNGTKLVVTSSHPTMERGMKGSLVTLKGEGSSIQWKGAWGRSYKFIKSHRVRDNYLPIRCVGGELAITKKNGVITATVVALSEGKQAPSVKLAKATERAKSEDAALTTPSSKPYKEGTLISISGISLKLRTPVE